MSRTTIAADRVQYGSVPSVIDTTNGNHFDLSGGSVSAGPGMGRVAELPLHLFVANTAGSGTATVKAGYGPWGNAASDLSITIAGTSLVDIGPQITRAYARDNWGSFDIDWTTVAGTCWLVFGNVMALPANVAQAFQVKDLPGTFLGAALTTTGTAAGAIYDNVSAATGTQLLSITGSSALGFYGCRPVPAQNGIVVAGIANAPALSVVYV